MRARRLSHLATLATKEVQQADEGVAEAEKKSKDKLEVIGNELKRTVNERHNQLVVATKALLEKGAGEGREGQVAQAVEQVGDLLQLLSP